METYILLANIGQLCPEKGKRRRSCIHNQFPHCCPKVNSIRRVLTPFKSNNAPGINLDAIPYELGKCFANAEAVNVAANLLAEHAEIPEERLRLVLQFLRQLVVVTLIVA